MRIVDSNHKAFLAAWMLSFCEIDQPCIHIILTFYLNGTKSKGEHSADSSQCQCSLLNSNLLRTIKQAGALAVLYNHMECVTCQCFAGLNWNSTLWFYLYLSHSSLFPDTLEWLFQIAGVLATLGVPMAIIIDSSLTSWLSFLLVPCCICGFNLFLPGYAAELKHPSSRCYWPQHPQHPTGLCAH